MNEIKFPFNVSFLLLLFEVCIILNLLSALTCDSAQKLFYIIGLNFIDALRTVSALTDPESEKRY